MNSETKKAKKSKRKRVVYVRTMKGRKVKRDA